MSAIRAATQSEAAVAGKANATRGPAGRGEPARKANVTPKCARAAKAARK